MNPFELDFFKLYHLILKGKKLPQGHVTTRKDGSQWVKKKDEKGGKANWVMVKKPTKKKSPSKKKGKKPIIAIEDLTTIPDKINIAVKEEKEKELKAKNDLPFDISEPKTGTKYSKDEIASINTRVWHYFQRYAKYDEKNMEGDKFFGYEKEWEKTKELNERLENLTKKNQRIQYLYLNPMSSIWQTVRESLSWEYSYNFIKRQPEYGKGLRTLTGHKKLTKKDTEDIILEIKNRVESIIHKEIKKYEEFFSFSSPEQVIRQKDSLFPDNKDKLKVIDFMFNIDFKNLYLQSYDNDKNKAIKQERLDNLRKSFSALADKARKINPNLDKDFEHDVEMSDYRMGLLIDRTDHQTITDYALTLVENGINFNEILPLINSDKAIEQRNDRANDIISYQKEVDRLAKFGDYLFVKKYNSIGSINRKLNDLGLGKFRLEGAMTHKRIGFRYISGYGENSHQFIYEFSADHKERSIMDNFRISSANFIKQIRENILLGNNGEKDYFRFSPDKDGSFTTVEQAKEYYLSSYGKDSEIAKITKKNKRKKS